MCLRTLWAYIYPTDVGRLSPLLTQLDAFGIVGINPPDSDNINFSRFAVG